MGKEERRVLLVRGVVVVVVGVGRVAGGCRCSRPLDPPFHCGKGTRPWRRGLAGLVAGLSQGAPPLRMQLQL